MAKTPASKTNTAEQELQKAEATYVQLHGSLYQGYDVSPITRGELKVILEDLLVQFGKAPAPEPAAPVVPAGQGTPDMKPQVDLTGIEQFDGKTVDEMKEIAKMMQIDASSIDFSDDLQLWKEFVTAAINAKGA
jgi:hypothetical protein